MSESKLEKLSEAIASSEDIFEVIDEDHKEEYINLLSSFFSSNNQALEELSEKDFPKPFTFDDIKKEQENNVFYINTSADILSQLAAEESYRNFIRDTSVIPRIVHSLKENYSYAPVMRNLLRVLGNLCYENDESRTQLDACNALSLFSLLFNKLLTQLNGSVELNETASRLLTTCGGFVLNVSSDNPTLRRKFAESGVMPLLLTGIKDYYEKYPTVGAFLYRGVSTVFDHDAGKTAFIESKGIETSVSVLCSTGDATIRELSSEILEQVVEEEKLRNKFASIHILHNLIQFVNKNEGKEENAAIVGTVAKIVSTALTEDECMMPLFDTSAKTLSDFLNWLASGNATVRMAGALSIGNLARRDDHCIKLLQAGVLPHIVKLFPATDAREQHAALGALKNLSIPAENKEKILDAEMLEGLKALLHSPHDAIQFLAVSTLRVLSTRTKTNCLLVAGNKEVLERCAQLRVCENVGTKCETGRLFANIMRFSESSEIITELVNSQGVIEAVSFLLTTEHTMLHSEAIFALTIAMTVEASIANELVKSEPALIKILKTPELILNMKLNVLTFMKDVFTKATTTPAALSSETVEVLTEQKNTASDESIKQLCTQILDLSVN